MSIICCQKVFRIIQNLHQNGRPSRMEALLKCRHYLGIAHGEGGSQRLPGWVGKTFIRNEVPQRARLSAGRRVQKLFGQCPNSACMTLIGASLHPPLCLTWGGLDPCLDLPFWGTLIRNDLPFWGTFECREGGGKSYLGNTQIVPT